MRVSPCAASREIICAAALLQVSRGAAVVAMAVLLALAASRGAIAGAACLSLAPPVALLLAGSAFPWLCRRPTCSHLRPHPSPLGCGRVFAPPPARSAGAT